MGVPWVGDGERRRTRAGSLSEPFQKASSIHTGGEAVVGQLWGISALLSNLLSDLPPFTRHLLYILLSPVLSPLHFKAITDEERPWRHADATGTAAHGIGSPGWRTGYAGRAARSVLVLARLARYARPPVGACVAHIALAIGGIEGGERELGRSVG